MIKNYLGPIVCVLVALSAVFYFYKKSESALSATHENILLTLTQIKQTETTLEKDTLRARNFLIPSYDPIVTASLKLVSLCQQLRVQVGADHKELFNEVDKYCQHMDVKVQAVERFKSKNAILKNSLHYIQKLASDWNESKKNNVFYASLSKDFVNISLAYGFLPTIEAREALVRLINKVNSLPPNDSIEYENLFSLSLHSSRLLEHREELDENLKQIVLGNDELEKLNAYYFSTYHKSEDEAAYFRKLLFVSCLALLLLVVYGIYRLIAAARALARANIHLEKRVQSRTQELETEKKAMTLILGSMDQGLFTFDKDGIIGAQTSQACSQLFSKNIAGTHVNNIFDVKDQEQLKEFIGILFNNATYNESFLELFPSKISVNEKVIKLDYKPIIESDTLKAVLCVATDLTAMVELENKTTAEASKNAALIRILSNKNDFIETIELVESLGEIAVEVNEFKRRLHTLKGSFSFLECRWLADMCHQWEENLKISYDADQMRFDSYKEIRTAVEKFITDNAKVLRINTEHQIIQLSLVSLIDTLKHVANYNPHPKIYDAFNNMMVVSLQEELQTLNEIFLRTAGALGKNVEPIVFDPEDKIPTRIYRNLFRSFIHIVRNTADHGVESIEEIGDSGKTGTLSIKLFESDFGYEIHFLDNGPGVNIESIRESLLKMGFAPGLNESEVLNSIFVEGFSTKEDVSEFSGRGVGLGVVREEARKLGGDCYAINEPGGGLRIVVMFRKLRFSDMALDNNNKLVS